MTVGRAVVPFAPVVLPQISPLDGASVREAHCAQASTAKNNGNLNGISQIAGRKLIPILKNKGDISSNAIFYRGIKYFKLTSLFMKLGTNH